VGSPGRAGDEAQHPGSVEPGHAVGPDVGAAGLADRLAVQHHLDRGPSGGARLHHQVDLATFRALTALMLAAGVAIFNEGDDAGTEAETLQAVKLLVERGADVNQIDDNGETAVHGAAYRGHNSVVKYLADRQAKLDVKNRIGWTPVTIADGVLYAEFFKQHRDTAALLRQLLKERGIAVEDAGIVNQDPRARTRGSER